MIDFNALHGSAHNTYQRWGKAADDIQVKYLNNRSSAIERARYTQMLKDGKVKKEAEPPASTSPASSSRLSPEENAAQLKARFGKKQSSPSQAPGDKLVASGPVSPSSPAPVWSSAQKGNGQPDLSRSRTLYGSSPYHMPGAPSGGGGSAPVRPSMMQAVREGVADIQASRIAQSSHMAQAQRAGNDPQGSLGRAGQTMVNKAAEIGARRASLASSPTSPAAPQSSGSWMASTGNALQARADQIGTERAVRSKTFGDGAQSHQTGHGRRAF